MIIRSWLRGWLAAACLLAAGAAKAQTTEAQPTEVDPALAQSWSYMQQGMPGVSYDLLKAACSEGSLVIYYGTWTDAQQAQVDQFKKRFPCMRDVRMFQFSTGPRRQRFVSESQAGHNVADIYQDTDPGSLDDLVSKGLLMKYQISSDASYAANFKHVGYWYPLRLTLTGIAWNTDLVSDEQAKSLFDWKAVLDPAWKGKSAVIDPSGGGIGTLPWYAWTKLFGSDAIQKIGALKPRIFGAVDTAAAALASGDVAVVFGASETGPYPLLLQGAPIHWSLPEPGLALVTGQAISAHAPHPDAAKLYQEYAFGLEGYGIWQKLGGAPARIGFKDQRDLVNRSWYKEPTNFMQYDPADLTKATPSISDQFHKWVGAYH